ncbi:SWIM zinc finger family protein [Paenibacillus polymyxa]|uniref:SWIM zinc finger family protein n=1 Tax=Paenibacillus polymyxa TaxID=1406 RepID=UPI0025B730DA|nr:SWIM zinc finger family protein [Paenibacillus polymyxa]MDN4083238.1 SWIM zinc finger family protein [Paenibacillus polymyxa]MDN4089547.1 SWIM zinc finger family protein [Paenibacillus polymyxa]MDN4110309.1 SWIM zinc finger family protein [Paenibacillus polymyxa]
MKPTYLMDDIQWQQLIQNVADHFNDVTIKRGFQYFKQGKVKEFAMTDADHIAAVVDGNELYEVDLHLSAFAASRCTCPVRTNCKHMIAVLLNYANEQERSVHALVNAHSAGFTRLTTQADTRTTPAFRSNPSPDHKEATRDALRKKASNLPDMPVSEWHDLFDQCIALNHVHTQNSQYVQSALASIYAVKPPLSPGMQQLYGLHAHLRVLEKLVPQAPMTGYPTHTYMGYYTQIAADELKEAIERDFERPLELTDEPMHEARTAETLAYLREKMLIESRNGTYFSDAYYQFWLYWVYPTRQDPSIYTEELQHLLAAEKERSATLARLPWMLAQSWMYVYQAQDHKAWELLEEAERAFPLKISSSQLLLFLYALRQAADWVRLKDGLRHIGPLLHSHRDDHLQDYMHDWELVLQHLPDAEQDMWDTLMGMLPFAGGMYEEALLAHGKWRQWIDYQLSIRSEPLSFRVSVLQPIEKNAPELLLPFYHQAVERYVLEKNRSSYKAAVKLLKRLFKLYKKMKQETRWELFFMTFTSRHSRLRALQEELRKGKLLS